MRRALIISIAFTISACASTPSNKTPTPQAGSLSAVKLTPGECGLFVWTAGLKRQFVLFSQSQKSEGVWAGPDGEQEITMTSKTGTPSEGQHPQQSFESAGLVLSLRDRESISQGTRYKSGTLTQTTEGWNRVTPVVGLSSCQPR